MQESTTGVFVPEDKEVLCSVQEDPPSILYKGFLWLFKFKKRVEEQKHSGVLILNNQEETSEIKVVCGVLIFTVTIWSSNVL